MTIAAVIPARLRSERLPGKPLIRIAGVPMIVRVAERVRLCPGLSRVIVATDSPEILAVVQAAGVEAQLTSASHRSGSDRVAEVAAGLTEDFILNVQGDEPLMPLSTLGRLVALTGLKPALRVATARVAIRRESEIANPNVVKVVADHEGRALYFSRHPIPYRRDAPPGLRTDAGGPRQCEGYFKHVGVYLYRRDFLLEYVRWPASPLELAESLEQLRILERGHAIHVVEVPEDSLSVDTPEDLAAVEEILGAASVQASRRA